MESMQDRIYTFIKEYMATHRRSPTIREIMVAVGAKGTSYVDYHLTMLEKRGLIKRNRRIARGIELPESPTNEAGRPLSIPVVGNTAAGPLRAHFPVEPQFLQMDKNLQGEGVFALRVCGRSMIDDCISDGDYVLLKLQPSYQNGDMIVAMHNQSVVDGSVTLKRYYEENDHVRLQPANDEFDPILIPKKTWNREWSIQGKVIAVFRQY